MAAPCIKGSGFESAVEDAKRLVAEGRLTQAELESRLHAEDLPYLNDKVLPSLWYPMPTYERLLAILLAQEGRGSPEYFVERGRRAAERLYKAGLYRQLEATIERWGDRFGVLMSGLGAAMFSETTWEVKAEGQEGEVHYRIEVAIPASFPECARLSSQGFIEFLGSRAAGSSVQVTSQRPSPTRMVFDAVRR